MKKLTQEILKELLYYDPDTGVFIWHARNLSHFKSDKRGVAWNVRFAGKVAGGIFISCGKSYVRIKILSKQYFAHRLANLYMTGEFPANEIDHSDGDGLNNIWSNLRDVDRLQNRKNIRLRGSNTSGTCGVSWHKPSKKWLARITIDSKDIHIGSFIDIEDAISAREEASIKYGFHQNHGSKRPL